jgi:hypothetical protein
MRVHRLFRAGAALALLGAFAGAEEQRNDFYGGLKLRGAFQSASREDRLHTLYLGFGLEGGYRLGSGRLTAELGFLYKAGRQYRDDITQMENRSEYPIDYENSVDSRKNQLSGLTLRFGCEKNIAGFLVKGGLQLGSLKFRQEYVGTVGDTSSPRNFVDSWTGVLDKSSISLSPFLGIVFPITDNQTIEVSLVGLNYKSANYIHVAGTVLDNTGGHTDFDKITGSGRFVPHLEVSFGFNF